jgi:hypothetical protein
LPLQNKHDFLPWGASGVFRLLNFHTVEALADSAPAFLLRACSFLHNPAQLLSVFFDFAVILPKIETEITEHAQIYPKNTSLKNQSASECFKSTHCIQVYSLAF